MLGPPRDPADRRVPKPERFDIGMATAIAAAVIAVVSAFYLPAPLMALIRAATHVVWGAWLMSVVTTVSTALEVPERAVRETRPGELLLETTTSALSGFADRVDRGSERTAPVPLRERRARCQRAISPAPSVVLAGPPDPSSRIAAPVLPAEPSYPSIAAKYPVANWFEREVMDFFGLVPEGHPNPTRVALHDDWPDGAWALRKDFPYDAVVPRVPGDFHPFRPVTGEGVFQVPVGPVHAGIIEPGHFRFGVAGEPVLYLQLRLFYVHKGTEKRFERLPWRHGLFLAESISGDTAVGHALAYAHAIERLAEVTVPARARALRVVLLELERLYNHTADIGALATDVAFTVPASRAQALREGLVRLQDAAVRHATVAGDHRPWRRDARLAARVVRCASRAPAWVREAVRRADPLAGGRRHVHRSR